MSNDGEEGKNRIESKQPILSLSFSDYHSQHQYSENVIDCIDHKYNRYVRDYIIRLILRSSRYT